MLETFLLVIDILVSYNVFHRLDDYEYPIREAIGTLIHDVNDIKYVKVSENHCRLASEQELADWRGPVSPWHKARLYPNSADAGTAL